MRKRTTRCSEIHLTRCRTPALTEISAQQRLLKCIFQCRIPVLMHSQQTIQSLFLLISSKNLSAKFQQRGLLHFLYYSIFTFQHLLFCPKYNFCFACCTLEKKMKHDEKSCVMFLFVKKMK